MRRTLAALALLTVAALATAGIAASASATTAPATSATTTTAPAETESMGTVDATALQQETADENFSVSVQTPHIVAANVTMNFSVDVTGADGTVTAEWTFEGNATKTGTTVQHAFDDGGNATVAVAVTDESGDTVTRELVVDVVAYGDGDDDDDSSNGLENLATIALFGAILGGVPLLLLLFVVPALLENLTDAL